MQGLCQAQQQGLIFADNIYLIVAALNTLLLLIGYLTCIQ
jgi:hypothetical protein